MIFCCVIFGCQKESFPAEIWTFKQFLAGHFQRENRECKKLDIISNRESEILLSGIFLLGGGKLRCDFDHLMYYVCFAKQHRAAIFLKTVNTNSEY